MAEEPKQTFDPDATVREPAAAEPDPEATVRLPPAAGPDPETTVTGPLFKAPSDPEATLSGPAFDPDATVNPAERATLDPEATIRIPSPGKQRRKNPFAPQSLPASLHANLAALGGINRLVELANPILGAVPEIRHALRHPNPAQLLDTLATQIEAFESNAAAAQVAPEACDSASYALCALLDDSAAATPWGASWSNQGLLQRFRGVSDGGEGFFALLDRVCAAPEANADLIEFLYVCLALGFEGRYRNAEDGRHSLQQVRDNVYSLIAHRRPRPSDGLSAHWRTPAAQAVADTAIETAARVAAARAAADAQAAAAPAAIVPARFSFARLPRRAIWSIVGGVVGSLVVFYLLALRLLEDDVAAALATKPRARPPAERKVAAVTKPAAPVAAAPTPTPTPAPARPNLARELEREPVSVREDAGRVIIGLRSDRQFAAGGAQPAPELRPVIDRIAAALKKTTGAIVVTGHADAQPIVNPHLHASNLELSAARARSVAQMLAAKLGAPGRVSAEGKGEAEPLAPNDSDANRARNRRVVITLTPAP